MNPAHLLFFFGAAAANLALTPLFIRLAHRYGLLDRPGHRKIHDKPVAKVGGLAIVASILLSVAFGLFIFGDDLNLGREREIKIALVMGVTLLATLLGFLDDLYDLRPRHKLIYQALLMGAFILFGFHFEVLHIPGTKPIDLSVFGIPLTLFWMLAVVNGFNFMDGVDGLAASASAFILAGIGVAGYAINGPNFMGVLVLSSLGAVLSFLLFNWRPAKVYLGDTGSNALGTLIACTLVGMGSPRPALLSIFQPQTHLLVEPYRFQLLVATLLAGYPFLEVALTTLRRGTKLYFLGRSMESSEQDHIHHQFLKMGFKAGGICLMVAVFQAVLSSAGILAMVRQNALAIWLLAPLGMYLAWMGPRTGLLDFLNLQHTRTKPHFMIANHFIAMQQVKLQLARTREEILALVSQTSREFGIRCFRFHVRSDAQGLGGMDYLYQSDEIPTRLDVVGGEPLHAAPGEFFDFCETPGQPGEAFWVFTSHTSADELDVEYRVLVNGFMRDALETAIRLGVGQKNLDLPSVAMLPHHKMSGHHLRKRHNAKLN